jgi:ABC-2 type transport system ATP-binding protein
VDPVSRREFWKLLSEFLAQGLTIVMATPYLDEAERCGHIALLHEGRLLALDEPGRLQAAHPGRLVEVMAEPHREAAAVLARLPEVTDVQLFGERAHVRLADEAGPGAADRIARALGAQAGLRLVSVRPVEASLEDVFIEKVNPSRDSGLGARGSGLPTGDV